MRLPSRASLVLAAIALWALAACDRAAERSTARGAHGRTDRATAADLARACPTRLERCPRSWLAAAPGAAGHAAPHPPSHGGGVAEAPKPAFLARGRAPGPHAFYWTRAVYTGGRKDGGVAGVAAARGPPTFPRATASSWSCSKRLVRLDAYGFENPVDLADPGAPALPADLRRRGRATWTSPTEEVHGLRGLSRTPAGCLIVDDFWGTREWAQFEYNIQRVLPGRPIVELPLDHPLFSAYYQIDEIKQVPNVRNARPSPGAIGPHLRAGRIRAPRPGDLRRRRASSWSSSTGTPTWVTPGSGRRTPCIP